VPLYAPCVPLLWRFEPHQPPQVNQQLSPLLTEWAFLFLGIYRLRYRVKGLCLAREGSEKSGVRCTGEPLAMQDTGHGQGGFQKSGFLRSGNHDVLH
jgi:hypothetical protein